MRPLPWTWLPRRIEALSVALYLVLGWVGVIAAEPLLASLDQTTLVLLLVGGVVYSAGVVFHLAAHWRYARALWHGSVVIAAAIVFLGDKLGVGAQLSTGVIVVLGIRIFTNVAAIRRVLFHA